MQKCQNHLLQLWVDSYFSKYPKVDQETDLKNEESCTFLLLYLGSDLFIFFFIILRKQLKESIFGSETNGRNEEQYLGFHPNVGMMFTKMITKTYPNLMTPINRLIKNPESNIHKRSVEKETHKSVL